jgi:putative transposase
MLAGGPSSWLGARAMNKPRKLKVTYDVPGDAHFLTYSCFQRLPLLSKDRTRGWVADALRDARGPLDIDLWAYVIMPEHVHLLLRPRPEVYRMKRILAALKRPVSVRAKAHLVATNNTRWLQRLTVRQGEREVFRFWQAGGGYDKNLSEARAIREVIDYIHANPVRRGLVERPEDWPWSSARFWAGEHEVPLQMDPLDALVG